MGINNIETHIDSLKERGNPQKELNGLKIETLYSNLIDTKISLNNYEEYKQKLLELIPLIRDNKLDLESIRKVQQISKIFFNVILIRNVLLELYANNYSNIPLEPKISDLLKKHEEGSDYKSIVLDNFYFAKLVNETNIIPNTENLILEDDEIIILKGLEKIMEKNL